MENNNILITGISSGIGKDAAITLSAKGYTIYGTVRNEADASYILDQGINNIKLIILDITDQSGINKLAESMQDLPLTALINNAGIAVSGPLKYVSLDKVKMGFDVNVFALLAMTQAFIPNLELNKKLKGEAGRIINISSISGKISTPFRVPYSASKFAVESISDGLRRELSLSGIKVSIIEPGPIKTTIWDKAITDEANGFINEYKYVQDFRNEYIKEIIKDALPVSEVSKAIYHAITSKKPKTRYLIVKRPWFTRLILNLPMSMIDNLTMKRVKLK
ncbi:MAG TPA: SDR family NAD(P)-dependent oxidoreductase [Saprospiraceae bacterium]|nr:SDR family NAD(P)-dependent oxidoreductase [Saprospiraceae bacterium]